MSSLGGDCSSGSRCLSRATVSIVSSTDSVVWDSQTTLLGSRTVTLSAPSGPSTSWTCCGRLAGRTDDLLVPLVADQQDVVVLGGEPLRLLVHLGHQRAGRVDRLEVAGPGLLVDLGRHAVRGEDHDGALGHLLVLLHEDRALRLQRGDHVLVVHDLLADVDRRPVELQRLLDGLHRAVDAGAVAAGLGQQHSLRRSPAPIVRARTGAAGRRAPARPVG